jgi:predicted RNA binding protein YcfA (HicA-like mRNA interferase family)
MNWYKKIILAAVFNQRKFIKMLTDNWGLTPVKKGDHSRFIDPFGRSVWIPTNNTGSTISKGVVDQILRKLEIPKKDFMMGKKRPQLETSPQIDIGEPEEQKVPEWQQQSWYQKQQNYQKV